MNKPRKAKPRPLTQRRVLSIIRDRGPVSSRQLATDLDLHIQTVRRAITALRKQGLIKSNGHNGYVRSTQVDARLQRKKIKFEQIRRENGVASEQMLALVNRWTTDPWSPRIFKSARNFPVGLASLYGLAASETSGSVTNQLELDGIRAGLDQFRQDLENTLEVVGKFLDTDDLWHAKKVGIFLLKYIEPEDAASLAEKIKNQYD